MILSKDLKDILCAFNARKVEYLVVGAYAVGVHAEPRATKDLDILIRATPENGEAVFRALADFGAPLAGLSPDNFWKEPTSVFQIGLPPFRIGILQRIEAIDFDQAWEKRVESRIGDEVPAHVLSREDLIRNKIAVGRPQDLVDAEKVREAGRLSEKPLG